MIREHSQRGNARFFATRDCGSLHAVGEGAVPQAPRGRSIDCEKLIAKRFLRSDYLTKGRINIARHRFAPAGAENFGTTRQATLPISPLAFMVRLRLGKMNAEIKTPQVTIFPGAAAIAWLVRACYSSGLYSNCKYDLASTTTLHCLVRPPVIMVDALPSLVSSAKKGTISTQRLPSGCGTETVVRDMTRHTSWVAP